MIKGDINEMVTSETLEFKNFEEDDKKENKPSKDKV